RRRAREARARALSALAGADGGAARVPAHLGGARGLGVPAGGGAVLPARAPAAAHARALAGARAAHERRVRPRAPARAPLPPARHGRRRGQPRLRRTGAVERRARPARTRGHERLADGALAGLEAEPGAVPPLPRSAQALARGGERPRRERAPVRA